MKWINIIAIEDEKWPEKSSSAAGLELATLGSTFSESVLSDSSVLHSSGWSSALVKWLSGRSTILHGWGGWTQPPKGISILTTPAPLLGLQHNATVPMKLNLHILVKTFLDGGFKASAASPHGKCNLVLLSNGFLDVLWFHHHRYHLSTEVFSFKNFHNFSGKIKKSKLKESCLSDQSDFIEIT